MSAGAPRVTTIPAGVSFVDALARGLLERWAGDPLALSRATVLLPTRRACRALSEAFLRAGEGRPLLLPRLMPLGDLDEEELVLDGAAAGVSGALAAGLPPAMPDLRRRLLLAREIVDWTAAGGDGAGAMGEDRAVRLAEELARLLDQVETEGLDFAALDRLVPEDYARHWQTTLRFLAIVTERWPAIQEAAGCIGPAARRRLLLEAQAEAWTRSPPADPVLVAGSTGSIPAAAALMAVVARLPRGEVVLPGLDQEADEATWDAIVEDPSHPQHGLARLLPRLGVAREAVAVWDGAAPEEPLRARVVDWALRPAARTADWRALAGAADPEALAGALKTVRRLDCPGPGEEAAAIAVILRGALLLPERRAALVTPDRDLARRVAAELRRWGVEVDDSAGTPLAETPPGAFLRLTAEMIAARLAPLPLLAALKHPLAAGGLSEGDFRARVRRLELAVLRGPRPAPGFAGLAAALDATEDDGDLRGWLAGLTEAAAPFEAALEAGDADLPEIVRRHAAFAEWLAAGDGAGGAERLWAREAGEAAADFLAELLEAADQGPAPRGEGYPALLTGLMAGRVVRPRYGGHPRLAILGPLEARLQHLDLLVLGGLNEGTWPAETDPGPWLSRPMRADFGLPAAERRIGLAAHDFAQALSAPEVFLTRAAKVEGTPTVPSRWLLRLHALLGALGRPDAIRDVGPLWLGAAEALDRPEAPPRPVAPPAPRPPVAARPRRLSVTRIETWMRDPYAIYAREILRLRPLDPLDADPGAADKGILIHQALEGFLQEYPETLPKDVEAALLRHGESAFEAVRAKPGILAFWWPRFRRIAHWLAEAEQGRRAGGLKALAEVEGRLELDGPEGPFVLTAKADRIDLLPDGGLAILDYKTGGLPKPKDIAHGLAPQLTLEAAMAARGGFAPAVPPRLPGSLEYWRVTGGSPPGEVRALPGDIETLAAEAFEGLRGLIAAFDDPGMPYHATPHPDRAPSYNDYEHLARLGEWDASVAPEGGP